MSVTAVHCCKLVREKIICMWAPQLPSYCDPVSVRGGERPHKVTYRNTNGLVSLSSLVTCFITCCIFNLCSSVSPEGQSQAVPRVCGPGTTDRGREVQSVVLGSCKCFALALWVCVVLRVLSICRHKVPQLCPGPGCPCGEFSRKC